jgi:hypothetical protein
VVKILEDYAEKAAPRAAAATRKEMGATTGAAISFPPAPVGERTEGGIESELEPRGRSSLELELEEEDARKERERR